MSVPQLQSELRLRGARISGRKADLLERLIALDRVQDVCTTTSAIIPPSPPNIQWPPASRFKSLLPSHRSEIPTVTKDQIEQYVLFRQVNDKEANQDISAMTEGAKMAKENVLGLSFAVDNHTFFSGSVEASMKKVVYAIRLILKSSGDVLFSACDCPAGAGPTATCKHLVAGLTLFYWF